MSKRNKRKARRTQVAALTFLPEADAVRPLLSDSPTGKRRQRIRWFIVAFLLVNLLVPLKWYLGLAFDADVDERFAWRMFSSNSMQRCQVEVREALDVDGQIVERPVPLETIISPAWAKFLAMYHQPTLVRHLLCEHCQKTDARSAGFRRTGTWSDGSPLEPYLLVVEREQE